MKYKTILAGLLSLGASAVFCAAAPDAKKPAPEKKEDAGASAPDKKELSDKLSETTNTVTIDGADVKYKATAGTIVIKDE